MASSRVHQLSNGLYVSGAPDKLKDKPPAINSSAMPYTGGDIKKSGELGKMFDIAVEEPRLKKSGPLYGGALSAGSFRAAVSTSGPLSNCGYPTMRSSLPNSGPQASSVGRSRQAAHSGPLFRNGDPSNAKNATTYVKLRNSGPLSSSGVSPGMVRHNTGPLAPNLPATGLITSGPVASAPISSSKKHSGPFDGGVSAPKVQASVKNQAINSLTNSESHVFRRNFPRVILWTVVPLFLIGFVAGGFILAAVQNVVLLIVVICLLCVILALLAWNAFIGKEAVTGFIDKYTDVDLSQAKDGHYVKVTGCHAVDFFISDSRSGLRALVKAGYNATVTPYVEESIVVDVSKTSLEIPPQFLRWLSNRNLSSDDRAMRLTEGYIKEGFLVTVMGVVQRSENILMIVPPSQPVSTGCQWSRLLLPATMDGLLLRLEDDLKADIIPV